MKRRDLLRFSLAGLTAPVLVGAGSASGDKVFRQIASDRDYVYPMPESCLGEKSRYEIIQVHPSYR